MWSVGYKVNDYNSGTIPGHIKFQESINFQSLNYITPKLTISITLIGIAFKGQGLYEIMKYGVQGIALNKRFSWKQCKHFCEQNLYNVQMYKILVCDLQLFIHC